MGETQRTTEWVRVSPPWPFPDNQAETKHVESFGVPRLDEGSIPSSSTVTAAPNVSERLYFYTIFISLSFKVCGMRRKALSLDEELHSAITLFLKICGFMKNHKRSDAENWCRSALEPTRVRPQSVLKSKSAGIVPSGAGLCLGRLQSARPHSQSRFTFHTIYCIYSRSAPIPPKRQCRLGARPTGCITTQ